MAKKKKTELQGFDPRATSFVVTNPDWVEPVLSESEPEPVVEVRRYPTVTLRGFGLHTVGINGQMHTFKGGEAFPVSQNIYRILKDADLIIEET